jgi:outer membrane protein assembly factor BamB
LESQQDSVTSQPIKLTLEVVPQDPLNSNPALVGAVGRDTAGALRSEGYTVQPVYTGTHGGPLVQIITFLTQTASIAWANKEALIADGGKPRPYIKRRTLQQRIGMIAAVACVMLLVGSLVVVLNLAHNASSGITIPTNACTPTSKTSPAPVVFTEKPGQSGLYAARSDGVYRFDVQGSHIKPIWQYNMNACLTKTPTFVPGIHQGLTIPKPSVTTAVTIADGTAYFGVEEDTGFYLYALHTSDGSLSWRAKVTDGNSISTPLVLRNLIYIETIDSSNNKLIIALSTHDGSVRWSYHFLNSVTDQSEGMGTVGNGALYVSSSNTLFALDTATGRRLWSTQIESNQIVIATRIFDGVLYANSSSTCFNCQVEPSSSAAYAYNPKTGAQLWQSQKVAGYLSPPTEVNGVVYFGSIGGYVYAVSAKDGTQRWHTYVGGEIRTVPQVVDGEVYVGAGLFLNGTSDPNVDHGHIIGLDAAHGSQKWSYAMPSVQYNGYEPVLAGGGAVYVGIGTDFIYVIRGSNGSPIERYKISPDNKISNHLDLIFVP